MKDCEKPHKEKECVFLLFRHALREVCVCACARARVNDHPGTKETRSAEAQQIHFSSDLVSGLVSFSTDSVCVKMKVMMMVCVIALWGAAGGARSCGESRRVYGEKHSLDTAPHARISGEHLRLCPRDYTCCSSVMEDTLARQSEADFLSAVRDTSQFLLTTFTQRHRKFDEFFQELLDVAEKSMNEMFTQTYGHLYTQNAHIFRQLFADLRRFYTGGTVSLSEVLADFWAGLVERMFSLVNPQYQFTEDYLVCVSKHAEQLQPFGDLPHKLHIQVSRALTAARALVQGLAAGRDIVNKATKLTVGSECVRALMRQWFCPLCHGSPSLKPCHSLCLNVMKGCLANEADLDTEWNNFIDALMLLVQKLGGPFHFELATDSIAVKVSEGIMYMQENSITVSAKVFQGCGIPRPTPARNKRSPRERDNGKPAFRTYSAEEKPTTASGTNLDRLVEELQERLRPMRGFWVALPHTICNDERMAADVTNEDRCWNGQTRGRYLQSVTADGLVNQINNPELEVDVARPDVKTRRLIMELRVAVNRLRLAQTGRDADFIDSDVEGGSGSGGAAEAGERFSDDWPGYGSFSPPRNTLPVDKPPRPRDRLRPRDMPTNKRNRLNGRSRSDAGRLSPALLSALLLLAVCFSLCL
ncbi:glypican-2 isoform X1 [Megalobrama amblycephala]|uniref:glypican-2 isoform X1 n=1 Tax=Megalobrama amblycephala TaxID=75352 RepID=UPI002013C8ED|nr:glypican-2 isoform X1 [Megalobrama amblycephala]